MKVVFDTNVVLDVLLERQPHAEAAARLFAFVDAGKIEGAICATTATTISYLAAKSLGAKRGRELVGDLLQLFTVAGVDAAVLQSALEGGFDDFEDAVVYEAARAAGAGAIVTRDRKGFAGAELAVLSPSELYATLAAQGRLEAASGALLPPEGAG